MTRHNIPVQPEKHVVDGFYDQQTGEVRIQLDLPAAIEGATNCALMVDASGSMDKHFRKPLFGGLSEVEKFIHKSGKAISELDSDHGVQVYLACLGDGTQVHDLGNHTQDGLEHLRIDLPKLGITLGGGTYLLPALKQAVKEIVVASGCAYGFIALVTDGRFADMDRIKVWATDLAKKIAAGEHPLTKIVLIGFDDADANQLEELDNLETGTDVDIFNALAVSTLQDAMQMLNSEAITGVLMIAPGGRLEVGGQAVKSFEGGLPQRIDAQIPAGLSSVTLVVDSGDEANRLEIALV
jgi:hypothetical protein